MDETRLTIGMIGAGFISHYHIQGLQSRGDRRAICGTDTEALRQRAETYHIPRTTTEIGELSG